MNRKKKHGYVVPMRTCIGCRECKPKKDMIRVALYNDALSVDPVGNAKGRGVYICRTADCLEKALKARAFQRGFRRNFDEETLAEIAEDIRCES